MTIEFWRTTGQYGFMSNFSAHSVVIDGVEYWTTEHFYQAQKFVTTDPAYAKEIRKAKSPKQAARLGRSKKKPLRRDWESVKVDVMRTALWQKVDQYPELKKALLESGNEKIVEDSPVDYYWGCGADGSGKNRLGKLWMELREQLRQA